MFQQNFKLTQLRLKTQGALLQAELLKKTDYSYIKGLDESHDDMSRVALSSKTITTSSTVFMTDSAGDLLWPQGQILHTDPSFIIRMKD